MSDSNFQRVAGGPRPLVRQTMNTCGLASLAMNLLHHSRPAEQFLLDLYAAKHAARQDARGDREWQRGASHDPAILWSEGYLLVKARFSRRLANWFARNGDPFVHEDFKIGFDMLLESMAAREAKREARLATAIKHLRHGTIRRIFVNRYLEHFKTQLELKILAAMFGFEFVPYTGDTMGNLFFENGDRPGGDKIEFMRDMFARPDHAAIVGHGQSHWMVPHTLLKGGPNGQEFALWINDPLGGSHVIPIKRLNHAYLFYFFKFHEDECMASIRFLRDLLLA